MPKENKEMALLLEFQCKNTTSEDSMDSPMLLPPMETSSGDGRERSMCHCSHVWKYT